MPKPNQLETGYKVHLLKVPAADIKQLQWEIENKIENPGWTANTIEIIITQNPIVEIDSIDEYGTPWYSSEIMVNGKKELHTIAILDEASWKLI
ncbi:MAG: hypothetical protein AAF705_19110 [Bacteroidota bacterium]